MQLPLMLDAHRPPIGAISHRLDTSNRARLQEGQHGIPIIGWSQAELEYQALPRTITRALTQLRWPQAIALAKHLIETPDTAEAAGEGHLGDRQHRIGQ